jgi:DNA-binding response OmpR family regulator
MKRILVIEDDEDILKIFNLIFQDAGYNVVANTMVKPLNISTKSARSSLHCKRNLDISMVNWVYWYNYHSNQSTELC